MGKRRGEQRFGEATVQILPSAFAISDRIGLLRIAKVALVQTAAITCGTRIAVVTTLEAIIDWRVAFVTEDKTSVEFIHSFHQFWAFAATRGEGNNEHREHSQVSASRHDGGSFSSIPRHGPFCEF